MPFDHAVQAGPVDAKEISGRLFVAPGARERGINDCAFDFRKHVNGLGAVHGFRHLVDDGPADCLERVYSRISALILRRRVHVFAGRVKGTGELSGCGYRRSHCAPRRLRKRQSVDINDVVLAQEYCALDGVL